MGVKRDFLVYWKKTGGLFLSVVIGIQMPCTHYRTEQGPGISTALALLLSSLQEIVSSWISKYCRDISMTVFSFVIDVSDPVAAVTCSCRSLRNCSYLFVLTWRGEWQPAYSTYPPISIITLKQTARLSYNRMTQDRSTMTTLSFSPYFVENYGRWSSITSKW